MKVEDITKLFESAVTFLAAISPLLIAAYFGFREKFNKKKKEVDEKKKKEDYEEFIKNKERCKDAFKAWEHEESQRIISKIKNLCNYYKDTSDVDLVSYGQLENGTVATSKLCNMFVTCLAEDDRFGNVSKGIMSRQRTPYSSVASWVDVVRNEVYDIEDLKSFSEKEENKYATMSGYTGAGSMMTESVKDGTGYFIGFVMFEYAEINFNNLDSKKQKITLHEFKASVQSIFITYHIMRDEKMKEYNLSLADINS